MNFRISFFINPFFVIFIGIERKIFHLSICGEKHSANIEIKISV